MRPCLVPFERQERRLPRCQMIGVSVLLAERLSDKIALMDDAADLARVVTSFVCHHGCLFRFVALHMI